jgi:excinuclease ABC subunit C
MIAALAPDTLLPPAADLAGLRQRVKALAEERPGIYRMMGESGQVLYVGKAKRLRTRVLSYFRAAYPEKAARILHAASQITWDYVPSEFAAHLAELREIRKHRPPYNVQMNRRRHAVFATLSGSPAPRFAISSATTRSDLKYFGPFHSPHRARDAIRVLNDLIGLRDCNERMPMMFAAQGDLFETVTRAACPRYDFGTCSGPCAGLVTQADYRSRVETAVAYLEGRTIHPMDRVIAQMMAAADGHDFERAARWRAKFESLEWLLAATTRTRAAIELLTFIYRDPGMFGDERAYLIRHGLVRAVYPFPTTPIEEEAFRAVVAQELETPVPPAGYLEAQTIDEMLLVMSWFRRHPDAMRRTSSLESWAPRS